MEEQLVPNICYEGNIPYGFPASGQLYFRVNTKIITIPIRRRQIKIEK